MKKMLSKAKYCALVLLWISQSAIATQFVLTSPDKHTELHIEVPEIITEQLPVRYSVNYHGQLLTKEALAWMSIAAADDKTIKQYLLTNSETRNISRMVTPVVKQKSAQIAENFSELTLNFNHQLSLIFRAYDDGVAYRFISHQASSFKVIKEIADFNFTANHKVYFPEEKSFISHNERLYQQTRLSNISDQQFASLPLMVATKNSKIVLTESALENYPGMWIKGNQANSLSAIFPHFVLESQLKPNSDRNEMINQRADYLAQYPALNASSDTFNFPWRIMVLAQDDKALLTNQLSFLLAAPNKIAQPEWIKPGKVAWDWWNANNIYGVDFKSGINTQTYKYYIDFAADYGLEYILLDEGWYQLGNVLKISPGIDVKEIIRYGKSKNVDVILWVIWQTLDKQLELALDTYQSWGAAGIKVDFMQRDDQAMVQYYWRVAEQAAKRQLLVNFHGSYKPAGLRRTYPNVITREGVRGLEHNKWADYISAKHNLTLPFIRMVAGPMDYTPGAMINRQPKNFAINFERPMSKTTRAHQVAMYVIYESPLQMLADSPSNYLKEAATTRFIAAIPTVWDETRIIAAKMSDHIISARRSGDNWFIGAINNEIAKDFSIDLSFLSAGDYQLAIFQDGINADRYASDYQIKHLIVNKNDNLSIQLAANGGWAARLTPIAKTTNE